MKPFVEEPDLSRPSDPLEKHNVESVRQYAIRNGGKEYHILRGDLHRHTGLSHDGTGDGSLWDYYRYMLDAASMDYTAVTDHQGGEVCRIHMVENPQIKRSVFTARETDDALCVRAEHSVSERSPQHYFSQARGGGTGQGSGGGPRRETVRGTAAAVSAEVECSGVTAYQRHWPGDGLGGTFE